MLTVRATYTGTGSGSALVVRAIQQAGCTGIAGLCDKLQDVTLEQGYVSAAAQPGNLTLTVQAAERTSPVVVTATYTEGDEAIRLPIGLTVQPAEAMACNTTQQGSSHVLTCRLLRQGGPVVFTATAPNPHNPSARFMVTTTVKDIGKHHKLEPFNPEDALHQQKRHVSLHVRRRMRYQALGATRLHCCAHCFGHTAGDQSHAPSYSLPSRR